MKGPERGLFFQILSVCVRRCVFERAFAHDRFAPHMDISIALVLVLVLVLLLTRSPHAYASASTYMPFPFIRFTLCNIIST